MVDSPLDGQNLASKEIKKSLKKGEKPLPTIGRSVVGSGGGGVAEVATFFYLHVVWVPLELVKSS